MQTQGPNPTLRGYYPELEGKGIPMAPKPEQKRFYLQHGKAGEPMRTEAVEVREDWRPQKRRGTVVACRFMVRYCGRWHRLYSDHAHACRTQPHFISTREGRIAVTGVCP